MKANDLTPETEAMISLKISGNVIGHAWYDHITYDNGKPYVVAVILLSEIVYWYRPVEVKDPQTHKFTGWRKKFKGDLYQRSYESLANQFGFGKEAVRNAIIALEKLGVLTRELRTVNTKSGPVSNVLYLQLHPEVLEQLNHPKPRDEGYQPGEPEGGVGLDEDEYEPDLGGYRPGGREGGAERQGGVGSAAHTYTETPTEKVFPRNFQKPTPPTESARPRQAPPSKPAAASASLESRNRNLLRSKLGRRRDTREDLLQQSLSEDDRRNDWLTLPEGRIEELIVEANPSARDGNFKTTLIGILDREVRQLRFKAPTPPVAAAPPDAPDVSEEDQRYMQIYGADWKRFKEDDERYQKERELERRKAHQTAQGSAGPN